MGFQAWKYYRVNIFLCGKKLDQIARILSCSVCLCVSIKRVWVGGKKIDLFEVHTVTQRHTYTHSLSCRRGDSLSLKEKDTHVS